MYLKIKHTHKRSGRRAKNKVSLNILWALKSRMDNCFSCCLNAVKFYSESKQKFRLFARHSFFMLGWAVLCLHRDCWCYHFFVFAFFNAQRRYSFILFALPLTFSLWSSFQHLGVSDKMSVNLLVFVIKWGHFCCHCRCRHCHRRHLCFCCAATASTFQTVKKDPQKKP